jgi:hypothetical protein
LFVTGWLAPLALGAFFSISYRGQMLAIVLTFIGMYPFLYWGVGGILLFGCNPVWTTLPILLAVLYVSRIRAWYWLREKLNWRTKLYTLLPVFGTIAAILIVLPFVRVYSVPYISWGQIDAYFDQMDRLHPHPNPLPEGEGTRNVEKRKALIQYIAANNAVPSEYMPVYAKMASVRFRAESDPEVCTHEEFLLVKYVYCRDESANPLGRDQNDDSWSNISFMAVWRSPWETARRDRLSRLELVILLARSGKLPAEKVEAIREYNAKLKPFPVIFDQMRVSMIDPNRPGMVP